MLTLPNGVVWIASYPKSGNTWMRILLSNLLAGGARPESINDLSLCEGMAGNRKLFDDQTLLDSHLLLPHEIEGLRPAVHDASVALKNAARFVKVHDAWRCLADGTPLLGRGARAALYLVRDPRDAAVSLAEWQAISPDRAIDQMNSASHSLGPSHSQVRQWVSDWSGHVSSWLDQTSLPVYPIRYEDLRADTALVFGRALRFLGVSFENESAEEAILRAVRHSDFAGLQRQEREDGFAERSEKQKWFFRGGRVGDWHRHLSEAQVRRIESTHAPTMTRLGYQLATDREAAV